MHTPLPIPVFPVPPGRRSTGLSIAPMLVICCLLIILFFIAASIILAIIPMYLPRKESTQKRDSSTVYYISTEDNTAVLDPKLLQAIAQQIVTSLKLATNSVIVKNGITGLQRDKR